MTVSKRKGWIRLGIVLSLAWILSVVAFGTYDYFAARSDTGALRSFPDRSLAGGWEEPGKRTAFTFCLVRETGVSCEIHFTFLALLALAPVIIGWLVAVAVAVSFRWVREGFRDKET